MSLIRQAIRGNHLPDERLIHRLGWIAKRVLDASFWKEGGRSHFFRTAKIPDSTPIRTYATRLLDRCADEKRRLRSLKRVKVEELFPGQPAISQDQYMAFLSLLEASLTGIADYVRWGSHQGTVTMGMMRRNLRPFKQVLIPMLHAYWHGTSHVLTSREVLAAMMKATGVLKVVAVSVVGAAAVFS